MLTLDETKILKGLLFRKATSSHYEANMGYASSGVIDIFSSLNPETCTYQDLLDRDIINTYIGSVINPGSGPNIKYTETITDGNKRIGVSSSNLTHNFRMTQFNNIMLKTHCVNELFLLVLYEQVDGQWKLWTPPRLNTIKFEATNKITVEY